MSELLCVLVQMMQISVLVAGAEKGVVVVVVLERQLSCFFLLPTMSPYYCYLL